VIPTIITQCLTQDKVKLGSLSPLRDFTFVEDTVDAFIRIAESDKTVGEVINIGSGTEISIGDLAKKIIKLVGRNVKVVSDEDRIRPGKSEVGRLLCDNSKAGKLIGWKPKTSLDDGLKKTVQWMKSNMGAYDPGKYAV